MAARKTPVGGQSEGRADRIRQQMLSGAEASSLGFVMLGCIGIGFVLGSWLDGRMHATMWTPIGVVVGAVAGFTEMVRTLMRMNRRNAGAFKAGGGTAIPAAPRERPSSQFNDAADITEEEPAVAVATARPRIFAVPPPPEPSFGGGTKRQAGVPAAPPKAEPEIPPDADLVERFLSDDQHSSQ